MRPKDASRIKCPPSVTKGWPFVILNVSGPDRPSFAAARPIASSVALQAETVDFDRQRKAAERVDQLGLVGDDDHARRAAATIFSRSSAPPPPLIRLRPGPNSSAPSMVRSSSGVSSSVDRRHAEFAAKRGGALRGRHADDLSCRRRPFRQAAARTPRRSSRCRCRAACRRRHGQALPAPPRSSMPLHPSNAMPPP